MFVAVATIATALAPGYSSAALTISELGTSARAYPWIINAGFIAYGMMVQGLGPGLYASAGPSVLAFVYRFLVIVYGAGGIMAGLFVTGSRRELLMGFTAGDIHGFAAGVTLSAISALMLLSASRRTAWSSSPSYVRGSLLLALLTLAAAGIFQVIPDDSSVRGLVQRSFFVTTMGWVFTTSIHIRQHQSLRIASS